MLWKKAPSEVHQFWERGNFSLMTTAEAFYYACERTQSNAIRVFFFHYSLANSMTNWVQIYTVVLGIMMLGIGIHQVRIRIWQLSKVSSVFKSKQKFPDKKNMSFELCMESECFWCYWVACSIGLVECEKMIDGL